jgi:hypothetical protein
MDDCGSFIFPDQSSFEKCEIPVHGSGNNDIRCLLFICGRSGQCGIIIPGYCPAFSVNYLYNPVFLLLQQKKDERDTGLIFLRL